MTVAAFHLLNVAAMLQPRTLLVSRGLCHKSSRYSWHVPHSLQQFHLSIAPRCSTFSHIHTLHHRTSPAFARTQHPHLPQRPQLLSFSLLLTGLGRLLAGSGHHARL